MWRLLLIAAALCRFAGIYAIKINIATEECFTEAVHEPQTSLAGSFVAMMPQEMLATQRQYDLTVRALQLTKQPTPLNSTQIYDPQGNKVYEVLDRLDDSFSIVATARGVYKFCLVVSDYRKNQGRWHSHR